MLFEAFPDPHLPPCHAMSLFGYPPTLPPNYDVILNHFSGPPPLYFQSHSARDPMEDSPRGKGEMGAKYFV